MVTDEQSGSILLRAKITPEEWTRIRKEALDRRLHNSEFVARLLRAGLKCIDDQEGATE